MQLDLEKCTDAELWKILQDLGRVLEPYNFKQSMQDDVFIYWYKFFMMIEKEIDRRLQSEY